MPAPEKRPQRLVVHLGDDPVAELLDRKGSGVTVRYLPEALTAHPGLTALLSCSLPLVSGRVDGTAFFDGVLPEGQHRAALAARAGVAAQDTFGLLARYGRDVAGALVVTDPDRPTAERIAGVVEYDDETLTAEIEALPDRPLGIRDDSELSLAGLQDKLLLVDLGGGRWGRPTGGAPSTHILKLDHATHRGIVAAEAEALALARHAGLTTITTELRTFNGTDALIVSRFDRARGPNATIQRIHQEDACQATGRAPTTKYELRRRGGGPSFDNIAEILDAHAMDPLVELDRLAAIAAFTAMIGNADAHGKNIAFVHTSFGQLTLAPLYDTVPTVLWPGLTVDAAMSIGGTVTLDAVDTAAIVRSAARWHHSAARAAAASRATALLLLDAIEQNVIDPGRPLAAVVRARAQRFTSAGSTTR